MAGFFGLFGNKNKKQQSKDAYFLSSDDSKTYGDIDYMRTAKTVRRTFVKTIGNPDGGESISTLSSVQKAKKNAVSDPATFGDYKPSNGTSNSSFNNSQSFQPTQPAQSFQPTQPTQPVQKSQPAPSAPTPSTPKKRPSADSNMDMFRNMAKKIRK